MTSVMRRGAKGVAVRELQGLLNSKFGTVRVKPDGDFGVKTDIVVREFQKLAKLKEDGAVGPRTLAALHSQTGSAKPPVTRPSHDAVTMFDIENFFARLGKSASAAVSAVLPGSTASAVPATTPPAVPPAGVPPVVKQTDHKNFSRISFTSYEGLGYVVRDFMKMENHAVKLSGGVEVRAPGESLAGFKNECAQFVQYFGVPHSSKWRRGPRVCDFKPGELAAGTVVATLRDGKYYSDYSGRSHVGIYLSHDDYAKYLGGGDATSGIWLMDQWNGTAISRHKKKYAVDADKEGKAAKKSWVDAGGASHTKRASWTSDGEEYYVLMTA